MNVEFKKRIFFFFSGPLIILSILLASFFREKITLFPLMTEPLNYSVFGKIMEDGTQNPVEVKILDNQLFITYKISPVLQNRAAEISLPLANNGEIFDLSSYSVVKLTAYTSGPAFYGPYFYFSSSHLSSDTEAAAGRVRETIYISDKEETFYLELKNFNLANWWLKKYKVDPDQRQNMELWKNQALSFGLYDKGGRLKDITEPEFVTLVIKNVEIVQAVFPFYMAAGIVLFLYLLFLTVVFKIIPAIKNSSIDNKHSKKADASCYFNLPGIFKKIPYKKLNLANHEEEELAKIMTIVQERYSEPDLSIHDVRDKSGIPERRVSELLKKQYHLSFKQMITNLRIQEAKRLLCETDRNVNEIGYYVGFNHFSYFCRLFKDIEGTSPGKFREQIHGYKSS